MRFVDSSGGLGSSTDWIEKPAARSLVRRLNRIASPNRPVAILAMGALAAGVYVLATTVLMVIHDWSALPFTDQIEELIFSPWQLLSPWLFEQRNEHRLVLTRLMSAIDTVAFAETNVFTSFCNIALPLALTFLLVNVARRDCIQRAFGTTWLLGVSLAVLFSAMQFENFVQGFNLGFFGVELAAAAAIFFVVLGRQSPANLAAVIVCEAVALYSLSSGVLVPVLTIILAWWGRRPWKQILVLIIAAVALIEFYLRGYITPGGANPLRNLLQPETAQYALVYLGQPIALIADYLTHRHPAWWTTPLMWATAFGALGVIVFGVAMLFVAVRGRAPGNAQLVFFGIATYSIGVAGLTALGRLQFGLRQALTPRYSTPVLLFWLSLALFISIEIQRRRPDSRWIPMVLSLPCLIGLVTAQAASVSTAWSWTLPRREAVTALLANVDDPRVLRQLYPNIPVLEQRMARLRAHHLSIFADAWSAWLGRPVADHLRLVNPAHCRGGIERAILLSNAQRTQWRISGWAWDIARQAAPGRIVLTNSRGRIVGYGLAGFASTTDEPPNTGWRGHFSLERDDSITAYALLDQNRAACPIAHWNEVQ